MTTKDKIHNLLSELTQLKAKRAYFEELKIDRESVLIEQRKAEQKIDDELADVMKLENLSLKSIITKIAGNKEEQLDKEKEEYMAATLALKEVNERLDLIDFEMGVIEDKLNGAEKIEAELNQLIEVRKKEIMSSDSSEKQKIINLQNDIYNLRKLFAEIDEAEQALKEYDISLKKIVHLLEIALFWQHKRTYVSRNKMLDVLNRVIQEYSTCKVYLTKLKAELRDIQFEYNVDELNPNEFVSNVVYNAYGRHLEKVLSTFIIYTTHTREIANVLSKARVDNERNIQKSERLLDELILTV